jgi:NAD(P)-dependent dehydrogenase (short-subunit alcohol dehydrogenase family)
MSHDAKFVIFHPLRYHKQGGGLEPHHPYHGPDGYSSGWTRIPHSTAKGALRMLTKSLAAGLGEYGLTVNDVNPGCVDTVRDETHPGMTPSIAPARA